MAREHKDAKKFTSEEVSVFCEQIAMLLNSGIPLYEGVYMLYSEMEDKKTKEVLERLNEAVKTNQPFFKSLQETQSFPDYMVHMVQVGETTGKLEVVMKSLAAYYERESNVKASIKSAITYPAILFAMMSVIILVLVFKILPIFESMFLELNADIVLSTKKMMDAGLTLGRVVAVLTCVGFFAAFFSLLWYRTKTGEIRIRRYLSHFILTRKLSEAMAISTFISGMALMISSGIDLQQAMEIAYGACSHRKIKEKIEQCKVQLEKGISLEDAIHESKLLVGMESRLVAVAAKTGAQDAIFEKLSEQYNKKVTSMLNKLSTTIETTLVITLATLVGAVLISVMLPLVSMISSIG